MAHSKEHVMNPEVTLSRSQQARIIGIVLGDGYLSKPRNPGSSQLVLQHSAKQLEYLQYKVELLRSFGIKMSEPKRYITRLDNGKSYPMYRSQSSFLKVLAKLRKRIYPKGRKTLRMPILSNIRYEDLVHIILDDGSIQRASNKGVPKYSGINIAFTCYSEPELQIFRKALRKHLGIDSTMHYKKGKPYVYINMLNCAKLVHNSIEVLDKIPTLRYKWQAFRIHIDETPRVLHNSETISSRELATRLMVKYHLFPHSDKKLDIEVINILYGNIDNFERAIRISRESLRVEDMIQT